jgi:Flp pilus assembly pilin Flp
VGKPRSDVLASVLQSTRHAMLRANTNQLSNTRIARTSESDAKALLCDERGVAMLEYTILIGSIAIAGSLGLVAVGVALVRSYDFAQALLLSPVP